MANRRRAAIVLLVLVKGLAGCDSTRPIPPLGPSVLELTTAPTPSPSGPTQMKGLVKDTAFRPLAGAVVEITAGPSTGLSTTTDGAGQFSLSGTFDNTTRFRASKEDHAASTATLINAYGNWISFHLAALATPVNIAGDYTLTFVADSACTGLPAALRLRTYPATLRSNSADPAGWAAVPENTIFNLTLGGASVQDDGIAAIGTAGDLVAFALFNDGLPYIVEEVAPRMFVAITGYAEISASASTGSTAFSGWIAHLSENPLATPSHSATTLVSCESRNHRLIWTRR